MKTTTDSHGAAIMGDNHTMAGAITPSVRRALTAPFTRRAWAELGYAVVSFPLAVGAFAFSFVTLHNGIFWAGSAPVLRKLGGVNRCLVRWMLGEDIPAPEPMRLHSYVRVRTPDAGRLAALAKAEDAKVKLHGNRVRIGGLPATRIAELAADEHVVIHAMNPNRVLGWYRGAIRDTQAWKIRGYFLMKPVIASFHLIVAAGFWLAGLFYLTYPAWQEFAGAGPGLGSGHPVPVAASFLFLPLGAALLLTSPWLTRGVCELDLLLIRGFLGDSSDTVAVAARAKSLEAARARVKSLEAARAHVVDDSAARLRSIERDLHDGAQAQLVALAMKLGLAKEKLEDVAPPDLGRVAQLVDDAHRNAIEAIAELRTLARGIHPSVLDNGLPDALATLAALGAVPVELVVDVPDRPSAAIETIAYFSAAELLANVAKHSGARHATLEAVHVPGLLRIRVTDDGRGGASRVAEGGLRGLAERVRTVDGSMDIDSPPGGPTAVTVELPSHA